MSINRLMDKADVEYIYNIYNSAIKKYEIMPFAATWMDLEIIILSEVSRTEKDKYHMILLIWGIWNFKKRYKWTYLPNRKRLTDIENKLMVSKGEAAEGINEEVGINIHNTTIYKMDNQQGPTV